MIFSPIPVYKNLSLQEFSKHVENHEPCIIRNSLADSLDQLLTLEYLANNFSENLVTVRMNTNCEKYRSGTEYKIRTETVGELGKV